MIAALKLARANPIVAADFSPTRLRLAERMGADVVVDARQRSPYAAWAQFPAAQPKRCVVFECVGVPGLISQAMEGAPRGSQIMIVGACMEMDSIDPMVGIYKELGLQFSFAYSGAEFAAVLRMIAEGELDVSPLITDHVSLAETPAAFDALADPEAHAKIMVEPWR